MTLRRGLRVPAAAATVAALLLAAASTVAAARPAGNVPAHKYDWHVTLGVAAPDCWERQVLLVNGQLGPTLEVVQGEELQLTLHNDLPSDWPNVHPGLSIHWHGFDMKGYPWYDGTAYVEHCPIRAGSSFTYRFRVDEPPGTYMWHGHSGNDRVDGFAGPLIVRPRPDVPQPIPAPQYDEERVLFIADWWHTTGGAQSMQLNRPFDANRTSPTSGAWAWVNNPQAILINWRGYYGDCQLNAGGVTTPTNCSVDNYWVPPGASAVQPWASSVNPGCTHENVTVEAGKTYLFRLISATSLLYTTVCFEGHDATIVAADAVPVEPIKASALNGCVDINSGQRYDVLLKADQQPGNFWITVQGQFRPGSPSGYGVLHYKDADEALPATKAPQPGSVQPWTFEQEAQIVMSSALLQAGAAGDNKSAVAAAFLKQALSPMPDATLSMLLNITQPLMNQTGQLRWAINNVAGQVTPPCQALLDLVKKDPRWIEKNLAKPEDYNQPGFNATALGKEDGISGKVEVFLTAADGAPNPTPPPIYPTAGTHLVPLKRGDVVTVVMQNLPANANGGDYRIPGPGASRNATEQHPMHLHGHHFWVLGSGSGVYDPATHAAQLNTKNPPFRDTATLPQNGWVVLRFVADNPGLWIFHCHSIWHESMGMLFVLAEAVEELPRRPKNLPPCPETCIYHAAPWTKPFVQEKFGNSGFELP